MIIEVFVFDEERLKYDLSEYNRFYIPERGGIPTPRKKIHPRDHSWFHYYKPIQVETAMFEVYDFPIENSLEFSIIEIDNDILFRSSAVRDKESDYFNLYSYAESKKRDLAMNTQSFGKEFSTLLDRELKLKLLNIS